MNKEPALAIADLKANLMMSHLLTALNDGQDIGHYGRLVFAMVARHFGSEEEVLAELQKAPGADEPELRALLKQVEGRDYNPPRPNKIHECMKEQEFPICPNPEDPDACNVYRDLKFPDHVYQNIEHYHEQKLKAS
jgi:hypothetical protein